MRPIALPTASPSLIALLTGVITFGLAGQTLAQLEVEKVGLQLVTGPKGRLALFGVGVDGAAYWRFQSPRGNGCWSDWSSLSGSELHSITAASNADGRLEVFARGGDGAAWHRWQGSMGGEWGGWMTLEGTELRQVTAVSNADGRLELFALGGDGAAWHRSQASPGGGWSGWSYLGGTNLRQLAASANLDGRLELFALGGDGAAWHAWQSTPGGAWGQWSYMGGTSLAELAVTRNADGRLELFAVGGDGLAWHVWQTSAGGGWTGWTTLMGDHIRHLAAGINDDGRLELIVTGPLGWLHHRSQVTAGGGWGEWEPLGLCSPRPTTPEELAAHWAPVISQDIDDADIPAEYITRADYDGNWSGNDNWRNIHKYDLPAGVYYWVTETQTHYFIGYGFYHPRDWSTANPAAGPDRGPASLEHENDLEAALLAIAKDGQHPFGRFLAMVTVAHSNQPSSTDTDTPEFSPWFQELVLSRAVTGGNQSLSGDVDFVVDNMGLHPVVYLEAEGHGAYAVPGRDVDDYSPMFNAHSITDWRGANWDGIVGPPASGSPTQTENTGSWDDGVIFHYEGVADIPGNTDNGNLPHHFQVVGYQLISIQELWGRRRDFEWSPDEHMFDDCNAFAGGHANPPWQWGNGYFLDPASLFELKFDNLGGVLWPQAEGYISRSYEAVAGC